MASNSSNNNIQSIRFPIWDIIYWSVAAMFMFFIFSNRQYDIQIRFVFSIILLIVSYFASWITNKILIPRLLFRGKKFLFYYLLFALILLTLWIILVAISIILLYSIFNLPNINIPTREDVIILISGTYIISLLFSVFHFIRETFKQEEDKINLSQQKDVLELKLKEAQLKLLKEQIHPHFIFNMMNNLYALVNESVTQSREVIVKLSDLMDYMLYECNADFVSLSNEIEFIKNYIELEKLRHDENFNVKTSFPKDLNDILIAPLILFPFIENAFKHGLKQNKNDFIQVRLKCPTNQIQFTIKNSNRDSDIKTNSSKGIGLRNVKERLELVYPEKHDLQIKSNEKTFEVNLKIDM